MMSQVSTPRIGMFLSSCSVGFIQGNDFFQTMFLLIRVPANKVMMWWNALRSMFQFQQLQYITFYHLVMNI